MPKVYNKHHKNAPPDAVYVGRPTKWGNPYIVGKHGQRGVCVEMYRDLIKTPEGKHIVKEAKAELRGKDLVCWCAPKPCHADVLLEIANGNA